MVEGPVVVVLPEVPTAAAASGNPTSNNNNDTTTNNNNNQHETIPTLTETTTTTISSTEIPVQNDLLVVVESDTSSTTAITTITNEMDMMIIPQSLYIVPPKQQQTDHDPNDQLSPLQSSSVSVLALPPLRYDEQVQSIRAALTEVIGYAHMTQYRFEMIPMMIQPQEQPPQEELSNNNMNHDDNNISTTISIDTITSPYTGKNAIISIPAVQYSSNQHDHHTKYTNHTTTTNNNNIDTTMTQKHVPPRILDEYGDLSIVLPFVSSLQQQQQQPHEVQQTEEIGSSKNDSSNHDITTIQTHDTISTMNIGFQLLLERYDIASMKDHIVRLRYLLDGNPPTIQSLLSGSGNTTTTTTTTNTTNTNTNNTNDDEHDNSITNMNDPNTNTTITTNMDTTTTTKIPNPTNNSSNATDHEKNNDEMNQQQSLLKQQQQPQPQLQLPDLPLYSHDSNHNVIVDGTNVQDFFYLSFGEHYTTIHSTTTTTSTIATTHNNTTNNKNNTTTTTNGYHDTIPSKIPTTTTTSNNNNNNHTKSISTKKKKSKNGHHSTTTTGNGGEMNTTTTNTNHNTIQSLNTTKLEDIHDATTTTLSNASLKERMIRYNVIDELTRCYHNQLIQISYSGYNPPPTYRKLVGDLLYIDITIHHHQLVSQHHHQLLQQQQHDISIDPNTNSTTIIHITATTLGFYVNKMTGNNGNGNSSSSSSSSSHINAFDPTPMLPDAHFSHTLLDCLLSASYVFRVIWYTSIQAGMERTKLLNHELNQHHDNSYISLYRTSIRGDFDGFRSMSSAHQIINDAMDASMISPSWIVPYPKHYINPIVDWQRNHIHSYHQQRCDDDFQRTYGIEIRNGAVRDWNEELQVAREMPTGTQTERLDRARLLHKVLTEFGEASLLGVKAITEGQITPMNPNEPFRSQVYLLNNIFVSRGVDTGPETFKIARGDRAAKKAANRDIQCVGIFHRMEHIGLYTLATVLIDYIGTRYVCQSILPGILIGEKAHTLLYGSVESGIPLKWDASFQSILEETIGQSLMIATRPMYRSPLSIERMEEIQKQRNASLVYNSNANRVPTIPTITEDTKNDDNDTTNINDELVNICVAVESKGILGSDQRRYMLDISRLTPRDANWVPKEHGGSGKFESIYESKVNAHSSPNNNKVLDTIPSSLDDDEWTMCVLRSELITRYTQHKITTHIQSLNINDDDNGKNNDKENSIEGKPKLDKEYMKTLKMNVNVFLPHIRSFTDDATIEQMKADEQLVRDVSIYLWDEILPKLTQAIRDGTHTQLPVDGKTLTELLHRSGINCRYLGRLAILAQEQEERDAKVDAELKKGTVATIERKTMPRSWLELLECEIVARAAKHVLDDYLTANGGVAAMQPAQTIASFLSALVSESEETAAQTETRMGKRLPNEPDDDDFAALTIVDVGGNGDAIPIPAKSRYEVWRDIEMEIGRRFRHNLILYNRGNKFHRALYIPLLRRVCQRTGVRLLAKNYIVGDRCLFGGSNTIGGRLTPSYPISPLDIADIVPLMKHAASYNEGFMTCTYGATIGLPPLQISMPDARAALERAHIQTSGHALAKGLELAQEAGSLYQRVTDNAAHPGVLESIELMATIFLEAGDPINAALNVSKLLSLTLQTTGFDSASTLNAHLLLFQTLFASHEMDRAVKHLRAAIYILEIMAGPRHTEHFASYHKLGTVYSHSEYHGKYLSTALECFREASNRDSCDRLMDGFMAKNFAKVLMGLENYKDALVYEKKSYHTLSMLLGKSHPTTLESEVTLQSLSKLAVTKGNRKDETDKLQAEAAIADSIAAALVAEEERSKKKLEKKKRGKK